MSPLILMTYIDVTEIVMIFQDLQKSLETEQEDQGSFKTIKNKFLFIFWKFWWFLTKKTSLLKW